MKGFLELPVHPDAPDGVCALAKCRMRLVTLSNGSTQVAECLFTKARILDHFERLLSVKDAARGSGSRCLHLCSESLLGSS